MRPVIIPMKWKIIRTSKNSVSCQDNFLRFQKLDENSVLPEKSFTGSVDMTVKTEPLCGQVCSTGCHED